MKYLALFFLLGCTRNTEPVGAGVVQNTQKILCAFKILEPIRTDQIIFYQTPDIFCYPVDRESLSILLHLDKFELNISNVQDPVFNLTSDTLTCSDFTGTHHFDETTDHWEFTAAVQCKTSPGKLTVYFYGDL